MNKLLSILKYLIGWPLSAISLIFIFKLFFSNFSSLPQITNINYLFLTIGILFFLAYFFLRSILWHEIIKEKGNKFSYKKSTYLWEISEIKRYTPGNIWSLLSRSKLFTTDNLSSKDMVSSLLNETVLIILSCFVVSVFYIEKVVNNQTLTLTIQILTLVLSGVYIFARKFDRKIGFNKTLENIKDSILPGRNYFNNLKILFISVLSFIMFGLATYFSSVSIFYLDPRNLFEFVSLFVFALLVGYLSIITPMGLGVREGVMTIGLSSFIPTAAAGILSIFTRIIFILSEVLFLGIIFIWNKTKSDFINRIENFITNHKIEVFLGISILIYVIYFSIASFLRYDNFYTGRFDLGNMDQAVWNSLNGRFFQITDPNGTDIISRLSFHADFILVLISPLYAIWAHPKMLLLLQSIVLGLGAWFVFLTAKEVLKNKNIALVLGLIYLINPAVGFTNLYDFHPVTLATTFLLACFYFFIKRKYLFFIVFAILAGLTKEHVWATIALFGLVIAGRGVIESKLKLELLRNKKLMEILLGIIIFVVSSSIFYYLIWQAIPEARGGNHFALEYYAEFGSSASDVFKNIIFSPIKTLSIIFEKNQLSYLFQIFFPLGFLSFLSPFILVFAGFDLGINLLSSNEQLHQIYYQYTAGITPFIFISAIYGIYFIHRRFRIVKYNYIILYLLITSLFCAYLLGPLPGSQKPNIDMFSKQLQNRNVIENYLVQIPDTASVAATNNLGSHLSRRERIYTIPIGIDKADYVVFLLDDFSTQTLSEQEETVGVMKLDPNYTLEIQQDDFVAFRRLTVSN